jgi:hypothetical protein
MSPPLRRPLGNRLAGCLVGRNALHLALAVLAVPSAFAAEASCSVQASAQAPTVVELYTSEGCSSCPPADRWLSKLKARSDVVALAFHVTYWDRLGWKDRFANPAYTQRQVQQQRSNGARYSYTPQIVVDGIDRPAWGTLPMTDARAPATVQVTLAREGERYAARVLPVAGAPARLAGFWAVTENGHATAVKAGENHGATLAHDFVVREYQPLTSWAADSVQTLQFSPATPADAAHPRQLNLVLVDADSGRPVQAVWLGC